MWYSNRLLFDLSPQTGPQLDITSLQGLWNVPDVLFGRLMMQLAHPSTGNVTVDTTAKVSTPTSST
jgi:hypothetical protein